MKNHPLRTYLSFGLNCVQGTDGGDLYGTDSMDEQLALERFLHLSVDEMQHMKNSEERVRRISENAFAQKQQALPEMASYRSYYQKRIDASEIEELSVRNTDDRLISDVALADRIRSLPENGLPVVVCGGSFNNDRHVTSLHKEGTQLIDELLEKADPKKVFFVIGHQLSGYEKYLLDQNHGRFPVFAIVPRMISRKEAENLRKAPLWIRTAIEASPMGLYKSFAYEIFKRRKAALIAFDGNSAGANMIQEARNGRQKCLIFVNRRSRVLKAKAVSLQGYVTLFMPESDGIAERIISASDELSAGNEGPVI